MEGGREGGREEREGGREDEKKQKGESVMSGHFTHRGIRLHQNVVGVGTQYLTHPTQLSY